jgi:hypothetical protein
VREQINLVIQGSAEGVPSPAPTVRLLAMVFDSLDEIERQLLAGEDSLAEFKYVELCPEGVRSRVPIPKTSRASCVPSRTLKAVRCFWASMTTARSVASLASDFARLRNGSSGRQRRSQQL